MNFEFSDECVLLRQQAQAFLNKNCTSKIVREALEEREPHARSLWRDMAELGWLGTAIPEEYGGSNLGYEALCVLAEELGRVLAPVPFSSSVYLASELILSAGNDAQRAKFLPGMVRGSSIATLALSEGLGHPTPESIAVRADDGVLTGTKWPVADGMIADFCIVVARDSYGIGLYKVDLASPQVERHVLRTFDPSRGQASIVLANATGERLGDAKDNWRTLERVLQRSAVFTAFEQIGGAEACLHMARDYAMQRFAFGRPIASFQAIKHRLADIYVDLEIARSNAYFGAWALSGDEKELPLAAAAARIAAIEAFEIAAKENIQIHGGVGFTWEFDCHLYYRRAKLLALSLGGTAFWKARLMDELETSKSAMES